MKSGVERIYGQLSSAERVECQFIHKFKTDFTVLLFYMYSTEHQQYSKQNWPSNFTNCS